jgi:hypothetical protein
MTGSPWILVSAPAALLTQFFKINSTKLFSSACTRASRQVYEAPARAAKTKATRIINNLQEYFSAKKYKQMHAKIKTGKFFFSHGKEKCYN